MSGQGEKLNKKEVELLANEVEKAARCFAPYTHRALKYVPGEEALEKIQARKPGIVPNITLQRGDFVSQLLEQYSGIKPGEVKLLVAATGVGKSTRLPVELVAANKHSGLVLMPNALLAYVTSQYVKNVVAPARSSSVSVTLLRTEHLKNPEKGNVVYYSAATDFLMLLHSNRHLCEILEIGYIYVDEAHESTPEYFFLKILAASGVLAGTRLLYGSATANTLNMETEGGGPGREIYKVPKEWLDLDAPMTMTTESPAHRKNIRTKTLIFVPGISSILALRKYYEGADIPVFVFTRQTSSEAYYDILRQLDKEPVCVLLTDKALETGHTLDVSVVIDSGYTEYMHIDEQRKTMLLERRAVTHAERIQRCGRVGRYAKGTVYVPDIQVQMETPEIIGTGIPYVHLWATLFCLDSKLEIITQYEGKFGEMSAKKAALLLHAKAHPLFLAEYMNKDGDFFNEWERVFPCLFSACNIKPVKNGVCETITEWPDMYVKDLPIVSTPEKIKAPYALDTTMAALPYAAWCCAAAVASMGKRLASADNRSVLTMVPGKPKVFRADKNDRLSVVTTRPNKTRLPEVVRAGSESAPMPAIFEEPEELRNLTNNMKRASVGSKTRFEKKGERRASIISLDSPGSPAFADAFHKGGVIRIAARDLKHEKVVPYDAELRANFGKSERRLDIDKERVNDMLALRIPVYDLDVERTKKYFLSLLRCWNFYVVTNVQILAAPISRGFFTRGYTENDREKFTDKLSRMQILFESFEYQCMYIAVDYSARQTHVDGAIKCLQHEKLKARLGLDTGNITTKEAVERVRCCMKVLRVDEQVKGVFLKIDKVAIGVLHTFMSGTNINMPNLKIDSMKFARSSDLVVFSEPGMSVVDDIYFRKPCDGEDVYLLGLDEDGVIQAFGSFTVVGYEDEWFYNVVLDAGTSGSALVAKADGCVVGFHTGYCGKLGDIEMSRFAAADKINFLM